MDSQRILITGISSHWGGRVAQMLEREPEVEAIVGIDTSEPRHELERTEFVRIGVDQPALRRIIRAAAIDTVIDTRLIDDPAGHSLREAQQTNVTGTRSLLASCTGEGGTVRKLIVKASARYYGCERGAPAFLSEDLPTPPKPRTVIERALVSAEEALSEYALRNPAQTVTVVRFADPIGRLPGSHLALLALPVVPSILGFDPRVQLIHEDDVVGVLAHAAAHRLPGVFNAAADGVLALSEIASMLGKPLLPVLPPWGTVTAAAQLRRLGLPIPVELLRELRAGRGLDNRRLKASGYAYRYTTREAILKLRAQQRLRPLLRSGGTAYRYDREVEEFLRRSPSVRRGGDGDASRPARAGNGPYDELSAVELIELIGSLEPAALARLREYEAAHRARTPVLEALDRHLARRGSP